MIAKNIDPFYLADNEIITATAGNGITAGQPMEQVVARPAVDPEIGRGIPGQIELIITGEKIVVC